MKGSLSAVVRFYQAPLEKKKELLKNEAFLEKAGITKERAMLIGQDLEGSSHILVREEVYKKVLEGAEPSHIWRDILPVVNVSNSFSLRVPKVTASRYANKIPEGGQFPERSSSYSKVDISIEKYGEQPIITEEMVRMSLFDIIELELMKAGASVENRLNREALKKILTNMTTISPFSPTGTHIAVTDIATGRAKVLKQKHSPDTLVLHPTAEGYLLQDSNLVYVAYAGQGRTLETGKIPKLLGLTPYTCTATDDDDSPTWDDTTAGSDVTALVLDSKAPVALIAMGQDITTTQWKDPLYDLHRIVVKMEFGVDTIWDDAGVQIYHK